LLFATRIRPLVVGVGRAVPDVRGRGRAAAILNALLLRAGAEPFAIAKMAAGHSLLVDCRLQSHVHALFSGQYDDLAISALLAFLNPGGGVLDVGANVGFWTVPLALAARRIGAQVIAFEPYRPNAEWLRANLRLNMIDRAVTIVEKALSSTRGDATLTLREDFLTGATIGNASVADATTDSPEFVQAQICLETLDEIFPTLGIDRLDLVKVDIEGHEDRFLEGAARVLSAHRPAILIEINRCFYERRGVDFNRTIPSILPKDYRFLTVGLIEIGDLAGCTDNDVLAIPREKITTHCMT
jgi:FkbM family methyltransferase